MKDNYVILDEIAYDTGAYEVSINTPIGVFTGYTEPDETDAKYPSVYHAAEIASAKALRKYAETSVNLLKRDIKMLQGLVNQAVHFANGDRAALDNNSFRLINGLLKQKKEDLQLWEARVEGVTKNITNRVSARDRIVAGYEKKDKTE